MKLFFLNAFWLTFFPSILFSQELFTAITIDADKQNSFEHAYWFDDNQDGLYDLIFYRDNQIYTNNGNSTFSISSRNVPETGYVWRLTDFDKNGTVDILSSIGRRDVYVMYNNKSGSFSTQELPLDPIYSSYQWIDIDGDGDLDYTFSSDYINEEKFSNKLLANINNNGVFNSTYNFDYEIYFRDSDQVSSIDIDNDSDDDLLVVNREDNNAIKVYKCIDQLKYKLDTSFLVTNASNGRVFPGDSDQDGDMDFLFTSNKGTFLYINTNGKFSLSSQIFGCYNYSTVDWGDFDNDGDSDFLLSCSASGKAKLYLYKNKSDGTFEEILVRSTSNKSMTAKWVEIDGDGFLDISIDHYLCSYWENSCFQPYKIEFLLNNNNSAPNNRPPSPNNLTFDFENERIAWIQPLGDETPLEAMNYNLLLSSGTTKLVYPFSNLTTGTPMFPNKGNVGLNNFYSTKFLPSGNYQVKVQSIDGGMQSSEFSEIFEFDIELPPENISVVNQSPSDVEISWSNPVLYNQIIVERSCDNGPFEIIAFLPGNTQEFNDEGINGQCTLVRYRIKAKTNTSISAYSDILLVDLSRFLARKYDFETDFWKAYDIAWADYDHDGDMDLVAFKYPELEIYRNEADDGFVLVQVLQNPGELFPILDWYDIDNDNYPDILASYYNEGIYTIKNQGQDRFEITNTSSPLPCLSTIGDLDRNGIIDIVYQKNNKVCYSSIDSISDHVLYEFEDEIDGLFSIITGDFNKDYYSDIFLFGMESIYLESQGELQYEIYPMSDDFNIKELHSRIGCLRETDLNNDGKHDIVLSYTNSIDQSNHIGFITLDENGARLQTVANIIPEHNPILHVGDFDNDGNSDICIQRIFEESLGEVVSPGLYIQDDMQFKYHEMVKHMEVRDLFETIDIDADGDLDIITNGLDEENQEFIGLKLENRANGFYSVANMAPNPPSELILDYTENNIIVEWNQGSDDLTSTSALTYNYLLKDDAKTLISPMANENSGQRYIVNIGNNGFARTRAFNNLKEGNYSFRVQSIDNGYKGSVFSSEVDFAISNPPVLKGISLLNSTSARISWEPPASASGFTIQRATSKSGPFNMVATLDGDQHSYIDRNLERNTLYYYRLHYYGENLLSEHIISPFETRDFISLDNDNLPNGMVIKSIPCDIDRDGFFDLAVLFEDKIVIYENDGIGKYNPKLEIPVNKMPADFICVDYNSDNRVDFLVSFVSEKVIAVFEQTDGGEFLEYIKISNRISSPKNFQSIDIDNDGRLDILYDDDIILGSSSGSETIAFVDAPILSNRDYSLLEVQDFDLDMDMDILFGGGVNSRQFSWIENRYPMKGPVNQLCNYCEGNHMAIGDFNADGYLDFVLFGEGNFGYNQGVLKLDNGNMNYETIELTNSRYTEVNHTVGDYDNNGYTDIIITGKMINHEDSSLNGAFINEGIPEFIIERNIDLDDITGSPQFIDIDNDGDLDIIVTMQNKDNQGIKTFINTTIHHIIGPENSRPTIPVNLKSQVYQDSVYLSWDSSDDLETPSGSLNYNIQIKNEKEEYIISPSSNDEGPFTVSSKGNVGFNKSWYVIGLNPGRYSWKVQAIDAGYKYSSFSEEQVFEVLEKEVTGLIENDKFCSVYPNPAINEIIVQGIYPEIEKIQIRNILGNLMMESNISPNDIARKSINVDLRGYPSGVYYLTIKENMNSHSIRFLIR